MRVDKVLFITFTVFFVQANAIGAQDITETLFSQEIDLWVKQGQMTEPFREMIRVLVLPTALQRQDWRSYSGEQGVGICTVCRSVLKTFIKLRKEGMSEANIIDRVVQLCSLLNLQTPEVCKGAVNLHGPVIIHIIDSRPNLTESTICGVILESRSCPLTASEFNWTIDIDNGPRKEVTVRNTRETMKIVQLTDIHYDPNYEPYGNADCKEPTCCRKGQNATNTKGRLAGYWGDYNFCDSPWHAVEDALAHVNNTHEGISYIYFTGDIIDHGVWETTKSGNIESLTKSYTKIYETFQGIPVYPILGNHEPHPLNLFAPEDVTEDEFSTKWLYEMMADMWIGFGWLPESTRSNILGGGFYTISPRKGFRIIALNSNVCYFYNWWLLYNPRDTYGQLQWLADTLLKAEENGELVHILSHIPAGDKDCLSTWRREYHKVVDRFPHIITAQFNGHSHNDELEIFYDTNNGSKTANNVAWNGGSVTAYANLNPNYKVYTVNTGNLAVEDYDNWMYNLTQANENDQVPPAWYKSYSFKEEYNLDDLSLQSLHNWLLATSRNENMLDRYYRHFFKDVEPSLQAPTGSKRDYLCRIITTIEDRKTQCPKILKS